MQSFSLPRLALVVASTLAVGLLTVDDARADGNNAHGQTLVKRGKGLNAAAFGVGLASRTTGAPVPVSTGTIAVSGLPVGAVINHAYLYWVTYGTVATPSLTVNGTVVTGTTIGTSHGTCWAATPTFQNHTSRADITARVTGNGDHVITGFPSATATADMQGASIFVVYTDPAATTGGHVLLYDGAATSNFENSLQGMFTDVQPPADITSARFMVGVGDGEVVLPDGPLRFANQTLPYPPPGGQHFPQSAGAYWDDRSYDVSAIMNPTRTTVPWNIVFSQDCLVFAYSALTMQSPTIPPDTTSGPDAGSSSSSGSSGSSGSDNSSGGSSGTSGGAGGGDGGPGNGTGGVAGNAAPADSASGCGCGAAGADTRYGPGLLVVAGVVGLVVSRLRRRR